MAKATYAKNFRSFRAFRVRKKEETLCLCVSALRIFKGCEDLPYNLVLLKLLLSDKPL